MPKLGKTEEDEVIKLLEKGHSITETAKITGRSRGYVTKINSKLKQKTTEFVETTHVSILSKESIQTLYNIQGLYGKNSLDETVKQIGEDFRTIMPYKYEFDHSFSDTLSDVFRKVYNRKKIDSKALKNVCEGEGNDWIQRLTLQAWNVDPAVFAFHDISTVLGEKGTIIEMMSKAFIHSFTSRGWRIKSYYNESFNSRMPIIVDPNGTEFKFPFK